MHVVLGVSSLRELTLSGTTVETQVGATRLSWKGSRSQAAHMHVRGGRAQQVEPLHASVSMALGVFASEGSLIAKHGLIAGKAVKVEHGALVPAASFPSSSVRKGWLLSSGSGILAGIVSLPVLRRRRGRRSTTTWHCSGSGGSQDTRDSSGDYVGMITSIGKPASVALPSDEQLPLTIMHLDAQLRNAVAVENYAEAARLRDEIQNRSFEGEVGVLAANTEFFEAWAAQDLERMSDIWHKGDHSCCIHAASRPVHGFEAIMQSWSEVFRRANGRKAECIDQTVVIRDNIGRVVRCQTCSDGASMVITNHFEKTQQGWKLSCHQVGSVSEPKQTPSLAQLILEIPNWIGRRWRRRKHNFDLEAEIERRGTRRQKQSLEVPVGPSPRRQ